LGQILFISGHAGLTASFISSAGDLDGLIAPFVYDFLPAVSWVSGLITVIVGMSLLLATSSKARVPLSNIWIALLIFHAALVIVCGVRMVMRLRDMYMIHYEAYGIFSERGLWAAKYAGFNPSKKLEEKISPDGAVYDFVESLSASIILKAAPYPFNILFFLGMRPDIAILLYIVLPGTFVVFSLPFAFAIRNYFVSERPGVVEHRTPYEGVPLSQFICSGVPRKTPEEWGDDEEDLASTFYDTSSEEEDEDYSASQFEGEEGDQSSLLSSYSSSQSQRA
jgi:hypothetical protein